jgi:hypothetical protein
MEGVDDDELGNCSETSKSDDLKYVCETGLTDEEYCVIGALVAQWGALEAEIFSQTVSTFGTDTHVSRLPKAMNNNSFTSVLELWNERVIGQAEGEVKNVLRNAYAKILKLKEFRNAVVHGMWQFNLSAPKTISTVRIKGDRLISTVFDNGSLSDFLTEVEQINFAIRYPKGPHQCFEEIIGEGSYVNPAALRRLKLDTGKG